MDTYKQFHLIGLGSIHQDSSQNGDRPAIKISVQLYILVI